MYATKLELVEMTQKISIELDSNYYSHGLLNNALCEIFDRDDLDLFILDILQSKHDAALFHLNETTKLFNNISVPFNFRMSLIEMDLQRPEFDVDRERNRIESTFLAIKQFRNIYSLALEENPLTLLDYLHKILQMPEGRKEIANFYKIFEHFTKNKFDILDELSNYTTPTNHYDTIEKMVSDALDLSRVTDFIKSDAQDEDVDYTGSFSL